MALDPESGLSPAPKRRGLRTGFTTGACAAAATRAACLGLRGEFPDTVEVPLPIGAMVKFEVSHLGGSSAVVIKDAGDDPDVTHGARVQATVELGGSFPAGGSDWAVSGEGSVVRRLAPGSTLRLSAGRGVGIVTRPGLGIPVGGPAINPVPRRMIARSVRESLQPLPSQVTVTVSIEGGEKLAQRTLNGRLGIVRGLSILGTTGVVRPYSTAAWRASVVQGVDVAAAQGCTEIVASTGGRSESYARKLRPDLPEAAFVEMGEFTGHLLKRARERGVIKVVLSGMVGKLSKIAQGHFMTHVAGNQVDMAYLAKIADRCGASPALRAEIRAGNTARHAQELVIGAALKGFFDLISAEAVKACAGLVGNSPVVEVLLFDFEGGLLGRSHG